MRLPQITPPLLALLPLVVGCCPPPRDGQQPLDRREVGRMIEGNNDEFVEPTVRRSLEHYDRRRLEEERPSSGDMGGVNVTVLVRVKTQQGYVRGSPDQARRFNLDPPTRVASTLGTSSHARPGSRHPRTFYAPPGVCGAVVDLPVDPARADAYLRKARWMERTGDRAGALALYGFIMDRFPGTQAAAAAREEYR